MPRPAAPRLRLSLLGRFGLTVGAAPVPLSPASQRLLAYVALSGRSVSRDLAAGVLWTAASEEHAHTNLRSALVRVGARAPGVLRADGAEVSLGDGVEVDLADAQTLAARLLRDPAVPPEQASLAVRRLASDLLPGWYDEWALAEAEQWRQLRLHALEALARRLADCGRYGEAATAAQAAVAADPLRESAHATVIIVHLAEGNQSEALRDFEQYRTRLRAELGLEPTGRLRALLPR